MRDDVDSTLRTSADALGADETTWLPTVAEVGGRGTDRGDAYLADLVGTTVNGRYRVERILGSGGMGVVFHAHDQLHDRQVAMKAIRADTISDMQLALFKAEFETLTKLGHPNIAGVRDFETLEGGRHFLLTMDYVDGGDLYSASKEGDIEHIVGLLVQVCRALAYIHSRHVAHFDIKPQNILVDGNGVVKVVDFGLAGVKRAPGVGSVSGTPAFMAPEVIHQRGVDHRADFYSLGITAYAVLCGRLPFAASTLQDWVHVHTHVPIDFDAEASERLPAWLRAIIGTMCAKDPADRFRSANAIIDQINRGSETNYEVETDETRESYILSSRFVGRGAELRRLIDFAVERTGGNVEAGATAIFVGGQSGIGKSRLMRETRHHLQLAGTPFLTANCYSADESDLAAISELLPQLVGLATAHGALDTIKRYGAALTRIDPALRAQVPHEPWASLGSPEAERARLLAQCTQAFLEVSEVAPYTLYINDLQWADSATVDLLESLLRRLATLARIGNTAQIAILGSMRSDEVDGRPIERVLDNGAGVDILELEPLGAADIGRQLGSMFGIDEVPAAFVERVVDETSGNPYFVEEVTRVLVESGLVFIENGAWTTAQAIEELQFPDSIKTVFLRRADLLEDRPRALLDCLTVCGHPVAPPVLQAALNTSSDALHADLVELERRKMIDRAGHDEELRFRVSHDRASESIYDAIEASARKSLHRKIGAAIESINVADPDEHVFELARHCWRGELWPEALSYAVRAGDRAVSNYAYGVAREMYERALGLQGRVGATTVARADVLERSADVSIALGDYGVAIGQYRQVLEVRDDSLERARLRKKIGDAYWRTGNAAAADEELWPAVTLLGGRGKDSSLVVLLRYVFEKARRWTHADHGTNEVSDVELERARVLSGSYRLLAETAGVACDINAEMLGLTASNRISPYGFSRERCDADLMLVQIDLFRGRYARAIRGLQPIIRMAEELEDAEMRGHTWLAGSLAHVVLGQWHDAIRVGRRAVEDLRSCGEFFELGNACSLVGTAYCQLGDLREGVKWTEEASQLIDRFGMHRLIAVRSVKHAEALVALGDFDAAQGELERLNGSVNTNNVAGRALAVSCNQVWGRLELARGDTEKSIGHLRRALEDGGEFTFAGVMPYDLVVTPSLLARAMSAQLLSTGARGAERLSSLRQLVDQAMVAVTGTGFSVSLTGVRGIRESRTYPLAHAPGYLARGLYEWLIGRRDRAEASFSASLEAAQAQGSVLQRAETLTEMTRCYQAAGMSEDAQRNGELALQLYRDMHSRGGVDQVSAILKAA